MIAQTIEFAQGVKTPGVDWIDASSGGVSAVAEDFRSDPAIRCRSRRP